MHAPAPGDSRTPRPGRRAPPSSPRGQGPGAGKGGALRRCRVFCAPRDGAASWRSRALRAQPRANPQRRARGLRVPRGVAPTPPPAGAECPAPAGVPAELCFLSWRADWAGAARLPRLSQAGRRGGRGAAPPGSPRRADPPLAPVAVSRVRVFFGKLHLFSSLVWASPERGRMSHRGAHSPGLGGAGKGAHGRAVAGCSDFGQLSWARARRWLRERRKSKHFWSLILGQGFGRLMVCVSYCTPSQSWLSPAEGKLEHAVIAGLWVRWAWADFSNSKQVCTWAFSTPLLRALGWAAAWPGQKPPGTCGLSQSFPSLLTLGQWSPVSCSFPWPLNQSSSSLHALLTCSSPVAFLVLPLFPRDQS